ncbi:MAG: ferritin [Verrucomicrobiia bacterium]
MLISKTVNAALNKQVGNELGASIQYIEVAAYFALEGLGVLSEYFFKQANEERDHALRIIKYIIDAGGQVEIPAIPAPRSNFGSAVEAVQLALDWENEVTSQINKLVALAVKENDYITQNMLNWFLNEQLEEVSSMDSLLKLVQRAGQNLLYVENLLKKESDKPKTSGNS